VAEKILELAFAIVAAEEVRPVAEVRTVASAQKTYRTRVFQYTDISMPFSVSFDGPACLDELVAESTTSSFLVDLYIDGEARLTAPYSWFQQVSQLSDWIDAFSSDSGYVLRLAGLCFSKRLAVSFIATESLSAGQAPKLSKVIVKLSEQQQLF
jgi:hypothetical protein